MYNNKFTSPKKFLQSLKSQWLRKLQRDFPNAEASFLYELSINPLWDEIEQKLCAQYGYFLQKELEFKRKE